MMHPDRMSPESVVAALYEVISGPAGVEREWARFRDLFVPAARLRVVFTPPQGAPQTKEWTPEQFAEDAEADYRQREGFWEREISSRVERFGSITHVWSLFESRQVTADSEPFARGINSIQLVREADGWAVANLIWDLEQPHNPISGSERYVPSYDAAAAEGRAGP